MAALGLGNALGNALARTRQEQTQITTAPKVCRQFEYGNYPGSPSTFYNFTPLYPLPNGDIFVSYVSDQTFGLNPKTGVLTRHANLGSGTHRKAYDGTLLVSSTGSFTEHTYGQLTSKRYAITGYSHWAKLTNGDSVFAHASNNNIVLVNSSGVVQWTRTLSSNTNTTVAILGLRETPNGGVYVFGTTTGTYFVTNTSTTRGFIAQFNTSGTLINSITFSSGTTQNVFPRPPSIGINGILYLPLNVGNTTVMQELNAADLTLVGSGYNLDVNGANPILGENSRIMAFFDGGGYNGTLYTKNTTGYQISSIRLSNMLGISVSETTFMAFNEIICLSAKVDIISTQGYTAANARPTFTIIENINRPEELFFWSGPRNGSSYSFAGVTFSIRDSSNAALSEVSATYTLTNTTAATCNFTTPTLTQSPAGPVLTTTSVTTM